MRVRGVGVRVECVGVRNVAVRDTYVYVSTKPSAVPPATPLPQG